MRPARWLISGLLLCPLALVAQTGKTDDPPGVTRLYRGDGFAGWQKFTPQVKNDPHSVITTNRDDPKIIVIKGNSPGYFVTEQQYGNYELNLEYCWYIDREKALEKPEAAPPRKSGVLFHIASEGDSIWPKCIKAQLAFGRAGDLQLLSGYKLTVNEERADPKDKTNFLRSHDGAEKPAGEWNTCTITCHGKFVSIKINDTQVMTARDSQYSRGRIALQSEAGEIHFRNITLKKLEGKPVDPEKDG
ncbi:MAG: DUF1080 domain-containing protein [Gemmatales bacterium]